MGKRWSAGALEDDTGAPILRVPSLQALALERIRDAILEGRLPPGTPLRINALAAELGMSPIPVREALQVLATEGLAVHLPHRGMTVSPLRAEDVAQTYEVRAVLEGLAARHAAGRLAPAVMANLRALLAEMETTHECQDQEALLRLDRAFHACICEAYPNRWASEFLRQIWNHAYRVRRTYPRSKARLRVVLGEHQAILAALDAGDGERAENLVRRHLEGARDDLLERLQSARSAAA